MTTYEWNTRFTTEFIDQFGTKIMFNPLHTKTEGSMITTKTNGHSIGGTYNLREENGNFYLGWYATEFLLRPNKKGFDLLVGETISYSFIRIE